MSKEKELAKNTAILAVGKIATQFISFLLLPLYTALLLPKDFGTVDLLTSYVTLLIPIFNWQFENGLFRFMLDARGNLKKQRTLFTVVFTANILQGIFFLILFLILFPFIHIPYEGYAVVTVLIGILLNTLLQFPRGLGDSFSYSFASFLSALVTVIMNVVLIAGMKLGTSGMLMATIIGQLGTLIFLVFSQKIWRYYSIKLFDFKIFKQIVQYSVPLIPNQLSWWVVTVSDRTIVSGFLGVAANGIYTVANKFPSVFISFYNIFNLSWTESVALHLNEEGNDNFIWRTINTMFSFFSALCLGIVSVMPFIFNILINKSYAAAYNQIPILMLAVFFQMIVGLYSAIYVALKKSVEIAKTSFFAAIINIVLNLALIKFIGIYAASISTLAAYALMAVYRYFDLKKYLQVPLESKILFRTGTLGIFVLTAYYVNVIWLNILSLLIVIVLGYFSNRGIIDSGVSFFMNKVRGLSKSTRR